MRQPKNTVSSLTAEFVRILMPAKKPGLNRHEILDAARPELREYIVKGLSNALVRGDLVSFEPTGDGKYKTFMLSPEAMEKYKNIERLTVVDRFKKPGGKKPGPKPKKKLEQVNFAAPITAAKEPENFLPLSISPEANNLADYVSIVVTQNAQYRAVLADIYKTIGNLLNPPRNQEKEKK